jgi:hypothetical protein
MKIVQLLVDFRPASAEDPPVYGRHQVSPILEAFRDTPAVLIAGGRQTGKTTLVRALGASPVGARYLTLDDVTVREAVRRDPEAFLADLDGPAILDEVQQAPELFPALRREIDRDRRPGRFLLTGSAHVLAAPEIARALVGRLEMITLWPLSQGEIEGVREGFVDAVFRSSLPRVQAGEGRAAIWKRVLRGGFPEAVGRRGTRAAAWFDSYVDLLLMRDVRDLARIEGATLLPRLVELLAARAGTIPNVAELSRSAGVPQSTLKRYLALLEAVFLVARIPAWSANATKRLARSPKLIFTDSGLLAHVGRIAPDADGGAAGPLLECFVAAELLKQIGWCGNRVRLHHFRTSAGHEVDFVLEDERGRLVGIEVKSRTSVTRADLRGMDALAEAAGETFHRGIVLYMGSEAVAFGSRLHALPVDALWGMGARTVRSPIPSS